MPLTEIAFASGFASVRRFNALLFGRAYGGLPRRVRRERAASTEQGAANAIDLRLDYRPPLDWDALLASSRGARFQASSAWRAANITAGVTLGERAGWLSVRRDPKRNALAAACRSRLLLRSRSWSPAFARIFDLDAQPMLIDEHLERDPVLEPFTSSTPRTQGPGAFDRVRDGRASDPRPAGVGRRRRDALSERLVRQFDLAVPRLREETAGARLGVPYRYPSRRGERRRRSPRRNAGARARTILELSRAVARGELALTPGSAPNDVIERLVALPGIGPWTAHYVALRALRWPNAFSCCWISAVRKALGVSSVKAAEERAARWEPWRAYGVLHLWTSLSNGG